MSWQDQGRKFVFEQGDVRGEVAQLHQSFAEILAIHQYAPGVAGLLGQFLTASVLLSTTIKFEGRLILQAQSNGEVPLLMVECDNQRLVRGIARGAEQATSADFHRLLDDGRLAITIEPLKGQRYQGIVSLDGDNLAQCLENYFLNSEQLPTRLWLASEGQRSAGLLLQQLPAQLVQDHEQRDAYWEHLCTLAHTVEASELLGLPQETLLQRLFHEDPLRLFKPEPVRFHCSCSRERCASALLSLGEAELESLFDEQPEVCIDCEFCNQQYLFTRQDLLGEHSASIH